MISIPSGVRVWLVTGHTDMIFWFPRLSLLVQETLKRNPHAVISTFSEANGEI